MKVEPQNAALPAARGTGVPTLTAAVTRATPAVTAGTLTGTLVLAAACWIIAVWQMHGMDMGTATQLGSFGAFIVVWVAMMAAMMLPGAAPALLRRAHAGGVRAVPLFAGSYLAVWALAGVAMYAVDRPHGTLAAGTVTVAAGIYEFTPVKKHFRRRGRASTGSGFRVRPVLRRVDHRADGDARRARCDEHHLDGGDHRPGLRPKAAAAESRHRCAAGAGDHRARVLDRHRARVGARARALDVRRGGRHRPRRAVTASKNSRMERKE